MGFSYFTVLVYGYIVREPKPTVIRDRGCNHEITNGNFCPECGKPSIIDRKEYYSFELDEEKGEAKYRDF